MAPRRKTRETEEEDARDTPKIVNVAGKGLGYYDKNTRLVQVSDVGLKLAGTAFSAAHGLKGNVWIVKYYNSKFKNLRRFFVPKDAQDIPSKFEIFLDKQSGEDSNFRIRSRLMWRDFVRFQEDRLCESGWQIKFLMAQSTGLQVDEVDFKTVDPDVENYVPADRSSERYIFDEQSMFNSKGKALESVDCVYFPSLNVKSSTPVLKGFR